MKKDFDQLFTRRLLVVAGKGGVGKTTVACALALEAARRGRRTLICEVDGGGAAQLLQVDGGPAGTCVEARPGVHLMLVDGKASLAEYLGLIIPVRRLLQAVFSSAIYQYFVAAAPGLKELMTVGKIWYEAERTSERTGDRKWDLVVLDAPATGHSLQYLRMPAAARDTFGTGLLHREACRVLDFLTDPAETAVNLVTIAEEMPVNETIMMFQELHRDLQMPTGMLFVNRMHYSHFPPADLERLTIAAAKRQDDAERRILLEVAGRAREEMGWTRVNARYRARLAEKVMMPVVELPFLFSGEFGYEEVRRVADYMCSRPSGQRQERRA